MKYWKKFFTKRMNEWDEGKKISAVLKITGAILCIILGILGWSWILAQIVLYVMENRDWIIFTIIVGIIFICALKVWFPLEIHNAPPMPEKPLNSSQITQALITNYGLLCTALMDVLPKLQPILKIHIPNYDSELHSEKKFIRLGTIVLYEYIIYKTDNVSTEFFKAALSQEIEMNLNLGKIIGMSSPYYMYEGLPLALIQVHSIQDCGAFYRVRLAIVNEDYCKYMRYMMSNRLSQCATELEAPVDKDF